MLFMARKKKTQMVQSKTPDKLVRSFFVRDWLLIILVLGFLVTLIWWKNWIPTQSSPTLQSHISALEAEIAISSKSISEFTARIKTMEDLIAEDNHKEFLALSERLTVIEKNLIALQENIKKQSGREPVGISPLTTALANLAFQLFSSTPYDAELERVRSLFRSLSPALNAAAAPHFSRLSTQASRGVPSPLDLQKSFDTAVLITLQKRIAPEDSNWWRRTLARLKELIVIRRLDHTAVSSTEMKLREAEIKLAAGKLEDAINIVEFLPKQEKIFFEQWLVQAKSRQSAINSYRGLVSAVS